MEELVTLKTAKLAKEKGFNTPCWDYINLEGEKESVMDFIGGTFDEKFSFAEEFVDYFLPSQSVLAKGLRKVHNIHVILKPILGSKNGYDSFPMLGWTYDLIVLNKNTSNSYYMGYPIGDWFTAVEESVEDLDINPMNPEQALEEGLFQALKLIP